jgi:hypothetical protein
MQSQNAMIALYCDVITYALEWEVLTLLSTLEVEVAANRNLEKCGERIEQNSAIQ